MDYFKYKATAARIEEEVRAEVEIRLQSDEEARKYFGDENCAKIRKHDGSEYYYISAEVVEKILKWKTLQDTALMILANSLQMKNLSKKEFSLFHFIATCKEDGDALKSIKKAYKGAYLADFYYNKEQKMQEKAVEEAKTKLLTERWGF